MFVLLSHSSIKRPNATGLPCQTLLGQNGITVGDSCFSKEIYEKDPVPSLGLGLLQVYTGTNSSGAYWVAGIPRCGILGFLVLHTGIPVQHSETKNIKYNKSLHPTGPAGTSFARCSGVSANAAPSVPAGELYRYPYP